MTFYDVKQSKTLSKWLLSYLIILLIPTLVIGYLFLQKNSKNAQDQVILHNGEKTANLARLIDDRLYEIKRLNIQWSVSPMVSMVVEKFAKSEFEIDYTEYMRMLNEIRNHIAVNEMILDIFIIVPNSKLILSAYGRDPYDTFFKYSYILDDDLRDSIIDTASKYTHFTIYGPSDATIYGGTRRVMFSAQSLRYSVLSPKATLIVVLDPEYISSIISSVFRSEEGTFLIYDYNKPLITSTKQENSILSSFSPDIEGFSKTGDIYAHTVNSKVSSLRYVFTFDKSHFSIATGKVSKYIVTSASLAFLFGMAVMLFFIYRNYNPLYKLFVSASNSTSLNGSKKFSEFEVIEESIKALSSQKADFENRLHHYEPVIKKDLLAKVIKGYYTYDQDIIKALNETGLECGIDSYFYVIVMELYNTNAREIEQFYSDNALHDKLHLIYTVDTILNENGYSAQVFESDFRKTAAIICLKKVQVTLFMQHMDILIDKVKSYSSNNTDCELYLVMGETPCKVTELSRSFLKAENALDRAVFIGESDEDPTEPNDSFYFYPGDWELQLTNNLKLGNLSGVRKLLDNIKSENSESRSLKIEIYKRLIAELIETGMKVISELDLVFDKEIRDYTKIIGSKSFNDMWSYVDELFFDICKKVNEIRSENDSAINNDLLDYVDQNITESDMSLIKVSEKFKLHPSSISKMFKSSTGYKFLDYVNRNRIEKAKELMDTTSHEIYNISEKVGYINYTSFSRVFSRYTGISPIEYKNLSASNHQKTK